MESRERVRKCWGLFFLTLLIIIVSISCGPVPIDWKGMLSGHPDDLSSFLIGEVRAPRVLLGALVAFALAISGSVLQAMLRNPLGDPGVMGVSSGAAFGALIAIMLSSGMETPLWMKWSGIGISAFGVAFLTGIFVLWVARRFGEISTANLLLIGIMVNALFGAGISFLLQTGNDLQLRSFTFWMLGSLAGATWAQVGLLAFGVSLGGALLWKNRSDFDSMLLGESESILLGVDPVRIRTKIILITSLLVGLAVSVSGMIGFIGLVIPHLARIYLGNSFRFQFWGCCLMGSSLLIFSDLIARYGWAPREIPIGVITAFLGIPILGWLMRREKLYANF
jgi:iron complex transport system permease protein